MANTTQQAPGAADPQAELQNAIDTIKRLTTTAEGAQAGAGAIMRDFMNWATEQFPNAFSPALEAQEGMPPAQPPATPAVPNLADMGQEEYNDFRRGGGGRY